ncbi:MAG: shikimate dehydrogenase [Candidatus Westeberhardia cardiocondylae]|nr:shikimate dehydrogenase [Candidatus Westeberhardia cardiocondylae]
MEKFFNVFGNPVAHSLSPRIYSLFSLEAGTDYSYGRVLVPIGDLTNKLKCFFSSGGLGANVTLPFKEEAFFVCDAWTDRALLSKTVNVIKKNSDGTLLGDNTDGIGLFYDLQRLAMIRKDSVILLLGAGGASRGVIPSLLDYGCKIFLVNRTFLRAKNLASFYCNLGDICVVPFEDLYKISNIDLVINATSISVSNDVLCLSKSIVYSEVFFYDMFYSSHGRDTSFISWCREQGAVHCENGLGMLVSQAAYSFFLWHNVFPSVLPVLDKLKCGV